MSETLHRKQKNEAAYPWKTHRVIFRTKWDVASWRVLSHHSPRIGLEVHSQTPKESAVNSAERARREVSIDSSECWREKPMIKVQKVPQSQFGLC